MSEFNLRFVNLMSKSFKTTSYLHNDGMVLLVDNERIATLENGEAKNISKKHLLHALKKKIYVEYLSIKMICPKKAKEFNDQYKNLAEQVVNQNDPLTNHEKDLLRKII